MGGVGFLGDPLDPCCSIGAEHGSALKANEL
jgi:hypothetical protein